MTLSRRRLLKSVGTCAAASTLLGLEGFAAPLPKRRLVCIFTPNGSLGQKECSVGFGAEEAIGGPAFGTSASSYQFGPFYSPLEEIRANTVPLSRLTWAGPQGWGHIGGALGAFTAWKEDNGNLPGGPSVDQFVASELQRLGINTLKRNLFYGISPKAPGTTESPFWSAPRVLATPEYDPQRAYQSLFQGPNPSGGGPNPALVKRRNSLERALADCNQAMKSLDASGREVLALYCTNLERMGKSLAESSTTVPVCTTPSQPVLQPSVNPADYPAAVDFFFNAISSAFSCDLSRVATFSFSHGAARLRLPFLGLGNAREDNGHSADDHHTWTHHYNAPDEKFAALTKINHWYSRMVVSLVKRLANTQDTDGKPLLDSTLVLWLNEYGTECRTGHDLLNIPGFVFTGNNEIRTNQWIRFDEHRYANHKALLTSVCRFMGLGNDDFGYNGELKPYDNFGTTKGFLKSSGVLNALYR
jgi:Protein of unknown function (DUF1552)